MYYGEIKFNDIADGEGLRTTLFVSGCTHHCKGCFQKETWDFKYGKPFDDEAKKVILESLDSPYVEGLTLLGGEPMEPANQADLLPLVKEVKTLFPNKTIWVYTGDFYESLIDPASSRHTEATIDLLKHIDILVDGPFIEELKDITARFKGSSNQRIIDVPLSLDSNTVIEWDDGFMPHSRSSCDL